MVCRDDSLPAGGVAATAEPPADVHRKAAPATAPGYASQLQPSRWGWVAQRQWCIWVEPSPTTDRWAQRWQTAVNAALSTWGSRCGCSRQQSRGCPIAPVAPAPAAAKRQGQPWPGLYCSCSRFNAKDGQLRLGAFGGGADQPGQRQAAIQATALHELGHGFGSGATAS